MRKSKLIVVMVLLTFVLMFSNTVSADIGPKPSLTLKVNYNTNYKIHVELLKKGDLSDDVYEYSNHLSPVFYDYLLDRSFDGYISATLYDHKPYNFGVLIKEDYFEAHATYRYPKYFKVLIFDETNNKVFITEDIRQEAFDSIMEITISDDNKNYDVITIVEKDIKISEKHSFKTGFLGIVVRVVLTIAAEALILFLFFYRKKESYFIVTLTNFITQLLLSIILFLSFYYSGAFIYALSFVIGEVIVIAVELLIFSVYLDEKGMNRAIIYTVVANAITIAITFTPFLMV